MSIGLTGYEPETPLKGRPGAAAGIGGNSTSVLGIGGVSGIIAFPMTSNRIRTLTIGRPGAGSGGAGYCELRTFCVFSFR